MFDYCPKELKKSHKLTSKAIKFLNSGLKQTLNKEQFEEWKEVKSCMAHTAEIMHVENELPKKMAKVIAFVALEEAIDRDKDQLCPDFTDVVESWWDSVEPSVAPICHELVNVSFDISRGYSPDEARKLHKDWLDEDPENRIFDEYYYAPDGSVIYISEEVAIS